MFSLPRSMRIAAQQIVPTIALALAMAACDTTRSFVPDQPPTVTLTSGPIDTVSAPQSWLVDIAWTATDPDGRVDHFEYAIDPPTHKRVRMAMAETTWVTTRENHVAARFRASHPDTLAPGATASDFHVFVLRAVDDRGGISPLVVRAFYATTVAPDVQITRPLPSVFFETYVPLPFRVDWHGHDPDGEGAGDPVGYRYRLLDMNDYANLAYLADPDSLLREGEASGWAGWRSVPSESTSTMVTLADLPSYGSGLLALVAVDAAGATTPYLMLDRNALYFHGHPPGGADGPRIHVFSQYVDFAYQSGGWSVDPLREIPIQIGNTVALEIHWDALATIGRIIGSRWMIDGDPADTTTRTTPDDYAHWSAWGPPADGIKIPPLPTGTHRLYIEEKDDFDQTSLAIVRIESIAVIATADLLVVNDTRREVDNYHVPDDPRPYALPWPSRAELDTFLFARGGVPWRGTKNPATGVNSPPGLLAGYAFDTLGTRLGLENPAQGVPLRTLANYRHVIWLVDATGSVYADQPLLITVLRAISQPGVASTLAEYIQMGGQVWLAGGGSAYASLIAFDKRSNNQGQITVFTARDGELGLGRPMYDAAHVHSALGVTKSDLNMTRSAAAIGGWSGHGPDGTLSAPDYSHAPGVMRRRDPGNDPLPPTRLASQGSLYYTTSYSAGFVLEPDSISEDFGVPGSPHVESALDTVYEVSGGVLPIVSAPVMLYYHGRENPPFVYTGFEPWDFTRADCQGVVDFVLHDIWRLTKSAPGGNAGARGAPVHVQRPATARVSARLDPHRMRP
jgi:hypothetical protein